ncbi:uncharacterized protein TNCV_2415221 [Trichonephila clavipes]|nr:uncharacterized protein TNCV_2415221 [Trichonephila clavipes]
MTYDIGLGHDRSAMASQSRRERTANVTQIQKHFHLARGRKVTRHTIRNRLHASDLYVCRSMVCLPLTKRSHHRRSDFRVWTGISTGGSIDHHIIQNGNLTDLKGIEVSVGITFQDGDRFNSCQVIYSRFGLTIHQNDHQARRRFVEWAQNEIAVVPDFHKRILFSDEAHFWLNGYVNKQNCRIWSEANPQVYVETSLHPEKLTVWCALWAGGILLQKR